MHSTWTKNWCWYPQNTCFLEQNAGSKHIPALSTSRCFKSFLHYRTSQVCFFSGLFDKLLLIEGLEDSIDVLRRNTNPRIIHFNVNLPFLIVIAARHRDASLMCEPGSGVSKLHLESWKKKRHVGWVLHTCEILQICLGQHVCILYFCIFHQRDILASLYDTNFYTENLDQ